MRTLPIIVIVLDGSTQAVVGPAVGLRCTTTPGQRH